MKTSPEEVRGNSKVVAKAESENEEEGTVSTMSKSEESSGKKIIHLWDVDFLGLSMDESIVEMVLSGKVARLYEFKLIRPLVYLFRLMEQKSSNKRKKISDQCLCRTSSIARQRKNSSRSSKVVGRFKRLRYHRVASDKAKGKS